MPMRIRFRVDIHTTAKAVLFILAVLLHRCS